MSKVRKFLLYTMLFSVVASVFGSFLVIDESVQTSPSLGLSLWFGLILILDLTGIRYLYGEIKLNIISIVLVTSYLFLTLGFVLNTKPEELSFIGLFALLILINIYTSSGQFLEKYISKLIQLSQYYIFDKVVGVFTFLIDISKVKWTEDKSKQKVTGLIKTSGIFLLTGLPLIIIVVSLLKSTNPLYAEWVENVFSFEFSSVNVIARLVFITVFTPFFIGEMYFIKRLQSKPIPSDTSPKVPDSLMQALLNVSVTTMSILNVFYLVFIFAEFKYDLGGYSELFANSELTTFSELAVARFWELIVITIINIAILYFHQIPFRKNVEKASLLFYGVLANAGLIVVNTLLLIFSAYQRISLYVNGYGFTNKRFLAESFLVVLVIAILLLGASVVMKRYNLMNQIIIALMLLFFTGYAMLPTDYIINKINLSKYENEQIQVYNPTYTLPTRNTWFGDGADRGYEANDIRSNDGLLVAYEILEKDLRLFTNQQFEAIRPAQRIAREKNWREWNFIEYLLIQKDIEMFGASEEIDEVETITQ